MSRVSDYFPGFLRQLTNPWLDQSCHSFTVEKASLLPPSFPPFALETEPLSFPTHFWVRSGS